MERAEIENFERKKLQFLSQFTDLLVYRFTGFWINFKVRICLHSKLTNGFLNIIKGLKNKRDSINFNHQESNKILTQNQNSKRIK